MGWSTYYGVGGRFDEQTITSVADCLVDRGLADVGYRIVWLDFGWASGARDGGGELAVDPEQWPHGLPWLTGRLHAAGLLAGIYTDAGRSGCDGQGVGSLGHYRQDADRFAAWGFDAVKIDFCGGGQQRLDPASAYQDFAGALRANASAPNLLINVCNPPFERSAHAAYLWAPAIAESWRTDTDIGFTGDVVFANVLRNLDANAAHPEAAGAGRWNDPDHLAPEIGLTAAEARAQLTMWAISAAPLVIGSDVRTLNAESIAMLSNREVIAIDQDALGIQGVAVKLDGEAQVWVKPLAGGDRAVALLNRGSERRRITTTASEAGFAPAGAYEARDLWSRTITSTPGLIAATVDAHGAALYRVRSLH
jgi:alpha-galactosidase